MPAPQNNQGFVAPRSGGTGNWIGKLFGGIGDNYRARSMAQLQLELHGERAKIDTEHIKERATHKAVVDAAAKDYLGGSGLEREKDRALFFKGEGANLSDVTQSSSTGISFQKKGLADRSPGAQQGVQTPEGETKTSGTKPPADRAGSPKRRAGTIREVKSAMSAGHIDQEQAAEISPGYARQLGRQTASRNITSTFPAASAGGINPLSDAEGAEYNKRANITGDGATPSSNAPAVSAPKVRKARTPKAGA